MAVYTRLLRDNPNYARLWMAQAISLLGDWFNTIAIATALSTYTNESGLAISLLLLCRFLPPLLVGPLAGVLLDRLNRKRLLILSDMARAVIVLGFLLADSPEKVWLIYVLTALQFAVSALFEPGRSALLPALVHEKDIVPANILGSVTWSVMLAVGGALGGLVAGVFGTPTALVIDSLTFVLSALLIFHVHPREIAGIEPATHAIHPLADFLDGWRYARRHPMIASTLLVKAGGSLGSMDTLMIIYATSLFVVGDKGAISLGILWAAFGLGAVLGPMIFQRFNNDSISRLRQLIVFAFMFGTAGWIIFALAPGLAVVAVALMVKGMGSIYWTYSASILQRLTDDNYLGRIFALDLIGFQASLVTSIIVTGLITDLVGAEHVRAVVWGTALISLIPLGIWWQITLRLPGQDVDAHARLPGENSGY
ncbi:MAG: MFS transporter [Chloroflexi bacterium]|nr:MFS transporter [Chloroflexota bacterium]